MVVTGVLTPGLVVNEQDLAGRLEIGRTPVREAIQRLAGEHMLTIFPRRGIAVSKVGFSDVQAIFEAREAEEPKLAALAAFRHSQGEAAELIQLGKDLNGVAVSQDYRQFLAQDQAFHRAVARAGRSRFLEEAYDHVLTLSEWIWHQFFTLNGSRPSDFFDHDVIIQAIIARDVESSYHEMESHIQRSRDVVRGLM